MGKLINKIPGSRLLISSLPGLALRTLVERSASLAMSTSVLKALPGKLDIKDAQLVFSIYNEATMCEHYCYELPVSNKSCTRTPIKSISLNKCVANKSHILTERDMLEFESFQVSWINMV